MTAATPSPRRIVSLLPSATEIIALLGHAEHVVGVSHECDYPEDVRGIEALTRSRLVDPGLSAGIDRDIKRLVAEALSIYVVDADALSAAAPDVIVTQDLCEVCAVSLDDVRAAVARLARRDGIQLITLSPKRLADVFEDIERVARALDVPERGRSVVAALVARVDAVVARVAQGRVRRPRVVSVEWLEPLMLGGMWMPDLIERAGGEAVGVVSGEPAPTVTRSELAALDPDLVLLKPCGFTLQRALEERALIDEVCAVLGDTVRVVLVDGNAFFNRPGPRLVDSLEILAACIHPHLFPDVERRYRGALVHIEAPEGVTG